MALGLFIGPTVDTFMKSKPFEVFFDFMKNIQIKFIDISVNSVGVGQTQFKVETQVGTIDFTYDVDSHERHEFLMWMATLPDERWTDTVKPQAEAIKPTKRGRPAKV